MQFNNNLIIWHFFLEVNHVDPHYNPVIIMKKGTANISIALQSPVHTPTI